MSSVQSVSPAVAIFVAFFVTLVDQGSEHPIFSIHLAPLDMN